MTRTSTRIRSRPPTRSNSLSCRTRSNATCVSDDSSPTSSRKMVPPFASSNRPSRRCTAPVNRSRDEFLPCAGLTGDEHRRLADSDLARTRERRHQRWRGAYDLLEHRGFVDFLTQGDVFLLASLLGGLAIVDIGTGYIPAGDLSLVIANWVG